MFCGTTCLNHIGNTDGLVVNAAVSPVCHVPVNVPTAALKYGCPTPVFVGAHTPLTVPVPTLPE
ncbi:MAG: hypothetical protein HQL01_15595 [Nitrospirae bacterium]|nr:hypothetical protein [Nitrospirota bacterium]